MPTLHGQHRPPSSGPAAIRLTRRSGLRHTHVQPSALGTPLLPSVQLQQSVNRSSDLFRGLPQPSKNTTLDANGQLFNSRNASTNLIRYRHASSKNLPQSTHFLDRTNHMCDEDLHAKTIAPGRPASCALPSTLSCDSLQHPARVSTQEFVWSMSCISMKALHFGDPPTSIGLSVRANTSKNARCLLDRSSSSNCATCRKPSPRCQSQSTHGGHHVGLTQDFRDVDGVQILAELHQIAPRLLALGCAEDTSLFENSLHAGSLNLFAMRSCSNMHSTTHIRIWRMWNTTRTTRQVHIGTHRCVTWQNWVLHNFQPFFRCSVLVAFIRSCPRQVWICMRLMTVKMTWSLLSGTCAVVGSASLSVHARLKLGWDLLSHARWNG